MTSIPGSQMRTLLLLTLAALVLILAPISPRLSPHGLTLGLDVAEAMTYRRARVTTRRVYRRGYRRAVYRGAYYGGGCRC